MNQIRFHPDVVLAKHKPIDSEEFLEVPPQVLEGAALPVDFERSLALLKAGEIDLAPWTVETALAQGQQAFDRMITNPGDTSKMLLRLN